jgi:hypothetical protein
VVFLLALYLKHVKLVEGLVWYVSFYIFDRVVLAQLGEAIGANL